MATYIQGLSDTIQQVPLYNMDTSFLQNTLDRRYSRFQQGESAIGQAYSSIINAPLTGQRTREMRDQYLQEAQQQLQKVATTDLSDPTNISAAKKIFEPFWADQSIILDTGLTSAYQKEQQTAMSVRDSKDEKVYNQYNPVIQRYLDGMVEDIAEADGDVSKLQGIQQRKYMPMHKWTNFLDEIAKEAGGKVVNVTAQGAYIQEVENGPASLRSWKTFALASMSSYSEEFRVFGTVDKEDRIRGIRSQNPGMTKAEATPLAVADAIDDMRRSKEDTIKQLDKEMEYTDLMKAKITGDTPNDIQRRAQYDDNLAQYKLMREGKEQELKNFDEELAPQYTERGLKNPDSFFGQYFMERTADEWGNKKANMMVTKITGNEVYKWAQDAQNDAFNQNMEVLENNRRQEKHDLEKQGLWNRDGSTAGAGTRTNPQGQKVDKDGKIIVSDISYATVDAANLGRKEELEVYQAYKENLRKEVYDTAFDPDSMMLLTDTLPSVADHANRVAVGSALKKAVGGLALTVEEKGLIRAFEDDLEDQTTPYTGKRTKGAIHPPHQTLEKIVAYGEKQMKILAQDPLGATLTPQTIGAWEGHQNYIKKREQYNTLMAEEDKLYKTKIFTDKKYDPILVGEGDKRRILAPTDLKKQLSLKEYNLVHRNKWSDDEVIKLSADEIAKGILNGDFKTDVGMGPGTGGIVYKGKRYAANARVVNTIPNLNPNNPMPSFEKYEDVLQADLEKIFSKHGKSEKLASLRKEAEESIIPNAVEYKRQTGTMGAVFNLNNDFQYQVAKEAALPGNMEQMYVDNEVLEGSDGNEKRAALQTLLSSPERAKQYLTNMRYGTEGPEGLPYVSFRVNAMGDKDKLEGAIGKLENKEVRIALNPAEYRKATYLGQLPTSSTSNFYTRLKEGKPIKADPYMKAFGADFQVVPNSTSNPSYVDIYFNPLEFNDVPGTEGYGTLIKGAQRTKRYSLESNTPDEIMGWVNNTSSQLVMSNKARYDNFQLKNSKKAQ